MSNTVRVVAPIGRDADLIVSLLRRHHLECEVSPSLPAMLEGGYQVGPVLLAEEALTPELFDSLARFVSSQPSWSDLPILVMLANGGGTEISRRLATERTPLGSPILLERPVRTATLVSSVQAAVRARKRQYEVREALQQRDQAVAELKQEQEMLRTVVDSMPVGVVLARSTGEIVLANPTVEAIVRHAVLPAADKSVYRSWQTFHEDGRPVEMDEYPLMRAIATGLPVSAEDYQYQRGDGVRVWVRLSAAPVLDEHGQVTGGVVTVTDVDEERRAADTLRRSEERFRLLVERASIGIAIGDLSGGLSYVNPTLLHTLGYTEQDFQNGRLRWDIITPPEYAAADAKAIEQLRERGVCEPYQKAYLARDGRPVPLLVGAVQIPAQGSAERQEIAVFLTDLSSQKQAEGALIQSEKLAAVGRLAASISHEINNPLEAVTNLLYLVASESIGVQAREYLDLASQELARVSQIAGQTLRFHRQSTRPRSVTPQELLESVLALYQGRMTNARVRAVTEYRGDPHFVCYEGDIRQVLNNLVGNAIDAMRGAGLLRVRSRAATHPSTGLPGVRITVADDGHGMSQATIERLFEPFYTTKGIHGTGLGLWISKGIVAKHNGTMQVRSRIGDRDGGTDRSVGREAGGAGGTVFALFLPRDLQPGPASHAGMADL